MEINLKYISDCKFEATNAEGCIVLLDGPPDLGGKNQGLRPMEMILTGLAGCSALDVLHILQKGKEELKSLIVQVKGERAKEIPAVFTKIHLHFKGNGSFSGQKLERAIQLSMEKYCSVAKMLEPKVSITTSFEILN
jgi:putative redox protein